MRLLRIKRAWIFLLLPIFALLAWGASANPAVTERVYSRGIYPVLAGAMGRLTSLFPFSLAEILILLAPLTLLTYIIYKITWAVKDPKKRRDHVAQLAATLLCLMGLGYALFLFFCGFNYHRETFTVHSGLETRPSSAQELQDLCLELVAQANALRELVTENEEGVMVMAQDSYHAVAQQVRGAFDVLGEEFPALEGFTARPKPVLLSRGMSYLDITGVYVPFTFEANVNTDIPDFWIPSTMMHELAHSKGFMREDEANFIAYLACMSSDNPEFQYSGTMLALVHSTNALYAADKEMFWPVGDLYSDGVHRDMTATSAYWKQFEGPVAEVSTAVNNAYLKANNQQNGVKSYGRMIDLLLADYRVRHEID